MHRHVLARLCVIGLSLGQPAAAAPGGPAPVPAEISRFAALDRELAARCQAQTFSGVVLIHQQGRELYSKTCGIADLVNGTPVARDAKFRIFSTSKLITALAIMRLVERGTIGLDQPITRYISEAPKQWTGVSIRTLLNHTSGIPDLTEQLVAHFHSNHPTAMHELLGTLDTTGATLASTPGERFAYNNFGFELLADAAAQATHKPFAQVVKEEVLDPAGMTGASVEPVSMTLGHPVLETEPGLALGYNGKPGAFETAAPWSFIQLGAGAVHATADDFIALDRALTAGRIVRPETWAMMTRDPVTPPAGSREGTDRSFGLGVIVETHHGLTLQGHTGGTNGYISAFERFPERHAVMIVLSNYGGTETKWLRDGAAAALSRPARA